MTQEADEPEILEDFHMLIVYMAVARALHKDHDSDQGVMATINEKMIDFLNYYEPVQTSERAVTYEEWGGFDR